MGSLFRFLLRLTFLTMLVIMPHELGHYAAMRHYGVPVVQIAVGFGPTLVSHRMPNGVVLSLKPILLGGFTQPAATGPHNITTLSAPQLIVIDLAGMFVNAALAFVALSIIAMRRSRPAGMNAPSLRRVPTILRPFAYGLILSYGEWIVGPPRMFASFVNEVRGRISDSRDLFSIRFGSPPPRWVKILVAIAALNVLVAQLNLLPFEPLDGGHVFALVMRMTLGAGAEQFFHRWSLVMLLTFVGFGLIFKRHNRLKNA